TSAPQPKFTIQGGSSDQPGQIALVVQGGAPVPIWRTVYNDTTTFDVNQLTGASALPLPTNDVPLTVAGVNFLLNKIGFANPDGGSTANAQVKMQGTVTLPKLAKFDLSIIQAQVDGTNFVIADSTGITLTGISANVTTPQVPLDLDGISTSVQGNF